MEHETEALSLQPTEGSFPFQINWGDVKKVAWQVVLVAASAVVTYLLQMIPSLHIDGTIGLILIPMITSMLQTLDAYLRDTRPKLAQRQLPYREYLRRKEALKQLPL